MLNKYKTKSLVAIKKYKDDSKLSIQSTEIYSMDLQNVRVYYQFFSKSLIGLVIKVSKLFSGFQ